MVEKEYMTDIDKPDELEELLKLVAKNSGLGPMNWIYMVEKIIGELTEDWSWIDEEH